MNLHLTFDKYQTSSLIYKQSYFIKTSNAKLINATSPAAKMSPMAMAAIMAMEIKSAEDIFLIPLLLIILHIARYKSGIPEMITETQAGLTVTST